MRGIFAITALAAGIIAATAPARAEYPDRPIRILLGFAAGSGADLLARYYAERLQEVSGAAVIVDNRPGASGNLAVDAGAKAKPDGYTILMASTATTAGNTALYKNVPFDVLKDIIPLAPLNENGFGLTISAEKMPVKDVAGLTAALKAKTGKATYGWATTVGLAASVVYTQKEKIEISPVGYKTTPSAVSDVIAGQIDFAFADMPFALSQEKQGKVKILAVTSAARAPGAEQVPTMDELGYKTSETTPLWAMWAPTGTPPEAVAKLSGWFNKIVAMPATREFLLPQGASPVTGDAAMMKKKLEDAMVSWKQVADVAKIDPQ